MFISCVFVQMFQLALRQQQLHAAHMQIKLQHQSNLVVGEHNLQHVHDHHHEHQQQQQLELQQRATSLDVDQVGSPALVAVPECDELNLVPCPNATGATWRTHDEHTTMSTTTHMALTTDDQRPLQTITKVRMSLHFLLDQIIMMIITRR